MVEEIRSAGRDAIAVVGNLMEPDFPKHLVKETIKAYGNINHIVNNAGFAVDKVSTSLAFIATGSPGKHA